MTPAVPIERFIRLRAAVQGALDAVPPDMTAGGWDGLITAYERLRRQIYDLIPEDARAEFDALFPTEIQRPRGGIHAMFEQQEAGFTARAILGALAGWLDGIVHAAEHETRLRMEAEAYARERAKSKRQVGFGSDS